MNSIRAIFYVDGFNLYHGLKDATKTRCYRWLDLHGLCADLLPQNHTLEKVIFFTSILPHSAAKQRRHETYISALESTGVEVVRGRFQRDLQICRATCALSYNSHVEKHTDVNISTRILTDAFRDRFDAAYIVTGDADQVPTIAALKIISPDKKAHVIFPPRRSSKELGDCSTTPAHEISPRQVRRRQLPIKLSIDGRTIQCPNEWDPEVLRLKYSLQSN